MATPFTPETRYAKRATLYMNAFGSYPVSTILHRVPGEWIGVRLLSGCMSVVTSGAAAYQGELRLTNLPGTAGASGDTVLRVGGGNAAAGASNVISFQGQNSYDAVVNRADLLSTGQITLSGVGHGTATTGVVNPFAVVEFVGLS